MQFIFYNQMEIYNNEVFVNAEIHKKRDIIQFCRDVLSVDTNCIISEDVDAEQQRINIRLGITMFALTKRFHNCEWKYETLNRANKAKYISLVVKAYEGMPSQFEKLIANKLKELCDWKYYEFKYINYDVFFYDISEIKEMNYLFRKINREEDKPGNLSSYVRYFEKD